MARLQEKTEPIVINWKPHPGSQERFHQNSAYECLFGGTKGPGKTECILREAVRQINNPNYRAIIFRRTFPRLGEIIDRSFKYFPGLGLKFSDKDIRVKLPAWTAPSGAKIAFGHVQHEQDKYNYQGKEFHVQLFDEIQEFTETQYLYIMAQNRSSDKTLDCYIRSTANPGGVGHAWVKQRFIDPLYDVSRPYRVRFKFFKRENDEDIETTQDDPHGKSRSFVYATMHDNPSLDQSYISTLHQLPEEDQKAFLYGDWDVFKGQYFSMWRKDRHVIEQTFDPSLKHFVSLDYGFGAQSAVLWWQIDYQGNIHAYRELYEEGLTYESLAYRIMQMTNQDEKLMYLVADPAIWGDKSHHRDEAGEAGAETMQKIFRDFTSVMKADNARLVGWGRMRNMLTNQQMTFSSRCKNAIRTIPAQVYSETKPEDLDTEGEDHMADSARYGAMSRPMATEAPAPRIDRKSFSWWERMAKQKRFNYA